jgi:hypothetical protein
MRRAATVRALIAVTAASASILASGAAGGPHSSGIVGGEPTDYESWKGVVALVANGTFACTGTLIDEQVVLSAAHCVYAPVIGINHMDKPEALRIVGGADLGAGAVPLSRVLEIETHPSWDGLRGADLSLLRLEGKVDSVASYVVREAPAPDAGTPGVIAGYGLGDSQEPSSAGVHRAGDTTCLTVLEKLIEVGDPAGTCEGDSGGPLFTEQGGRWVVTGVTSAGPAQGCDPMKGNWDVNVVTYRDWIEDVVAKWTGHGLPDSGPDGGATGDTSGSCGCATPGSLPAGGLVARIFP